MGEPGTNKSSDSPSQCVRGLLYKASVQTLPEHFSAQPPCFLSIHSCLLIPGETQGIVMHWKNPRPAS